MNCHVVISNVFYDGTGNLLTETDALGNRVTYAYTPEGWLESVTKADGTVLAFAYDRTGSLLIWIRLIHKEHIYECLDIET